jgi:hypothetical protein
MKPNHFAAFASRRSYVALTIAILFAVGLSTVGSAQSPPPVQGTVALEGTMQKFYRAANVVIVATLDGVEHAYRFTTDLVVHGGKGAGVDALEGLREGSTVVVHVTPNGAEQTAHEIDVIDAEGLRITEGVVTNLDRRHQEMTVHYSDGKTEKFRLTERAALEVPNAPASAAAPEKVAIYYTDERGQKVVHFFKRIS